MSLPDWIVLAVTLFVIIAYGVYKSSGSKNLDQYLVGGRSLPWYHIGLSVMATQASAITFLSAPGWLMPMECALCSSILVCRWP